ncbi:hypothetical protein CMUS01_06333 [Colletotrichum musicola]|uniref:Uncharacterized protein n=1 Tax=Colletotrichum musicola TaxID=2175873 RepID=A0A8H6NHM8_9PEZI|nr:hypothetical protein CMUS01_06333 [Colletotrichum musicola]
MSNFVFENESADRHALYIVLDSASSPQELNFLLITQQTSNIFTLYNTSQNTQKPLSRGYLSAGKLMFLVVALYTLMYINPVKTYYPIYSAVPNNDAAANAVSENSQDA